MVMRPTANGEFGSVQNRGGLDVEVSLCLLANLCGNAPHRVRKPKGQEQMFEFVLEESDGSGFSAVLPSRWVRSVMRASEKLHVTSESTVPPGLGTFQVVRWQ